jgi:hypothetical protein
MSWLAVSDYWHPDGWASSVDQNERARWYCRELEQGQILFFDHIPFELPPEHREFLSSQRHGGSRIHKNVSYRPKEDLLRGFTSGQPAESRRLHEIMRHYSVEVTQFLSRFLIPYAEGWALDFASYRPMEEQGRNLPLHKRNDLLHVDAFPSRPTRGARILRVFTNIHKSKSRIWLTGDRFEALAERFALRAGLQQLAERASAGGFLRRELGRLMRILELPSAKRSAYDSFMLRFHDYLKENSDFQKNCQKTRLEFPPNSTWIVFTDCVPHAALSGQFALEHTYIVPVAALLLPEKAPIRVLEALCGRALAG